jgi:hypothetical protein
MRRRRAISERTSIIGLVILSILRQVGEDSPRPMRWTPP